MTIICLARYNSACIATIISTSSSARSQLTIKNHHCYEKPTDTSSFVADDDFATQASLGNQVLAEKDASACQFTQLKQDVVAYSLFGAEPGYCEGAIINAEKMADIYPDWQMVLFYDDSVPSQVIQRLQDLKVQTISAQSVGIAHWPGTFWRFYAVCLPQVRYVLFRDTDSMIGGREQGLVLQWMNGDKPFHIMRDWYSHMDLILAGLWGAYAPLLAHMREWVESFISTQTLHPTHADQDFLAAYVWPRIKAYSLVHDSIHEGEGITAFPAPSKVNTGQDALGGYRYKLLEVKLAEPINQPYQLQMETRQGQVIFSYQRVFQAGQDKFNLPYEYLAQLQQQAWQLSLIINGQKMPLSVGWVADRRWQC